MEINIKPTNEETTTIIEKIQNLMIEKSKLVDTNKLNEWKLQRFTEDFIVKSKTEKLVIDYIKEKCINIETEIQNLYKEYHSKK